MNTPLIKSQAILDYFKEMKISTTTACAKALEICPRVTRMTVYALRDKGALRAVTDMPGGRYQLYQYMGTPADIGHTADLQAKAWRAMRIQKSFTAYDVALLSGASHAYARQYIRFLRIHGHVKYLRLAKNRRSLYSFQGKPGSAAPHMRGKGTATEERVQALIDDGWTMMRALLDGNLIEAQQIHARMNWK